MNNFLKTIAPIFFAACGFVIVYYLLTDYPLRFGAQEIPQTNNIWLVVFGFAVTLAGVLLGSSYRQLSFLKEKGETSIKPGPFFASVFTSIDLWMSLLGAPLVYALMWKSMEGVSIASLVIIALQNGFCCTLLISNIIKKQGAQQ